MFSAVTKGEFQIEDTQESKTVLSTYRSVLCTFSRRDRTFLDSSLRPSLHPVRYARAMPRVVNPVTVVELPGKVAINELFGGASCAPCGSALGPDISLAHVKAKAGFAEDWQAPAFDEYVLVLKGSVTIEHAHGPPAVVAAGCGVYLAKGERVRWVFKEDAEYVPICLPAFSPANVFREEPGHPPPVHDSHTHIYHLVQKPLWEACKAKGETYYVSPPSIPD